MYTMTQKGNSYVKMFNALSE